MLLGNIPNNGFGCIIDGNINSMEKILVIQTAFIGDAILTLPMIQKLKEKHSQSEIHVIAIPATEEIFSFSPFVNEVIILDKKRKHKSLLSLINFSKGIKKNNYTKIYSPHRSFRSSLIVMLSKVKETFGFTNSSLRHVYKHLVDYKINIHEVQRNLDLIGYDYNNDWKILPQIEVHEKIKADVSNYFGELDNNYQFAAVAPGSVWETKKYPIEYYEEIIKFLISNSFYVLLIGGSADRNLCSDLANKFKNNVKSTAGKFSLIGSIELLKRVKVLISNDSAPTHLGMCADIPTLTLYCSTVADFGFYPYNSKSYFLSYDDLNCKPCGIHGYNECPVKTFDCGYKLLPDKVNRKIMEIIND